MNKYPKFQKVDDNTIKIIIEKYDNIPLAQVIQNREHLLKKKAIIEQSLKNIDEILENARRLGITPKEQPSAEGEPTIIKPEK